MPQFGASLKIAIYDGDFFIMQATDIRFSGQHFSLANTVAYFLGKS